MSGPWRPYPGAKRDPKVFNEAAIEGIVKELTGTKAGAGPMVRSIFQDYDRNAIRRLLKAAIREGALRSDYLIVERADNANTGIGDR